MAEPAARFHGRHRHQVPAAIRTRSTASKKGRTPVTIFGNGVDVTEIDIASLRLYLASNPAACTPSGPQDWSMADRGDPDTDVGSPFQLLFERLQKRPRSKDWRHSVFSVIACRRLPQVRPRRTCHHDTRAAPKEDGQDWRQELGSPHTIRLQEARRRTVNESRFGIDRTGIVPAPSSTQVGPYGESAVRAASPRNREGGQTANHGLLLKITMMAGGT